MAKGKATEAATWATAREIARLLAAADMAQKMGAQIMGLGAFTKVVGDAGVTVAKREPLPITTGNSYSASGALWAAHDAVRRLGIAEVDKKGHIKGKAMVVCIDKLTAVYTCKQPSGGRWAQDFERGVNGRINPDPWQTDTSIGDWFYNRHWKYQPLSWTVHMLVDIVSKNGNLLLNVVLRPDGSLDPEVETMLHQLADWTAVNGEAIYGTTASPFQRLPWGRCTKRVSGNDTTLYLHVFNWPTDGQLLIPGLKNPAQRAYLLTDSAKKALPMQSSADGLTLTVPPAAPDPVSSTVVLEVKGPLDVAKAGLAQDYDGSVVLPASEARVHGDGIKYESGDQLDSLGFWTNPDDWADWEIKITRPGRFEVSAEIATLDSGSLGISAGDSTTKGTAYPTGDYGKFRP